MNKYIFKNFRMNFKRYILLSIAIVFSVALTMGIFIMNGTMQNRMNAMIGNYEAKDAIVVYSKEYIENEDIDAYLQMQEVVDADKQLLFNTIMHSNNKNVTMQLVGMTNKTMDFENLYVKEGKNIEVGFGKYEVLVDDKVAKECGINVGQTIVIEMLDENKEFIVVGLYNRERLSMQLQYDFYVDYSLLEEELEISNKCNKFILNTIDHNVQTIEKVCNKIEIEMPSPYTVQTILSRSQVAKDDIDSFVMSLWAVLIIIILCAIYTIYCSFYIILSERIHTLALFKMLGANSRRVKEIILKEGMIFGILSSFLGVFLGVIVGYFLSYIYAESDISNFNRYFEVNIGYGIISLVIGVLASYIGSVYPIKRIAGVSPISALKNSNIEEKFEGKSSNKLLFLCGVIIFVGALLATQFVEGIQGIALIYGYMILLGFFICISVKIMLPFLIQSIGRVLECFFKRINSTYVQLALRNLMRNTYKSANMMSLIIISAVIIIGLNGMFSSIRESVSNFVTRTYGYDYILDSDYKTLEECQPLLDKIDYENICETYTYENWYNMKNEEDNTTYRIFAVDAAVFDEYTEMKINYMQDVDNGFTALTREELSCFVSTQILKERNLKIGDYINISDGTQMQKYQIVGSFNTFTNSGRVVYIDIQNIRGKVFDNLLSTIALKKSHNITEERFEEIIQEIMDEHYVLNSVIAVAKAWKQDIVKGTEIFDAMNVLIVFFVLCSMTNSFIASIQERKREVAILYSIGANKKVISKIMTVEIIINVIITSFLGMLASYSILYVFVKCIGQTLNTIIDIYYPIGSVLAGFAIIFVVFMLLKQFILRKIFEDSVVVLIKRDSE